MKTKWKMGLTILFLASVAASYFHESPRRKADRLKREVMVIQSETLRALLKNDLKFEINLDEEAQFFVRQRADLQRCRAIEARLREISPGAELSQIVKNTTGIFELIAQREQQNDERIEFSRKQEEAEHIDWDKIPPWEPGAAGPPGTNKPAAGAESKPEVDDKLQPDVEGLPR